MKHQRLEDFAIAMKPRIATTMLLWGMVGFVLIFLLWAALAEIERTVRAQGRVVPSSQLQIVSSHEGGIIERILVEPGQLVEAGEELVRLDPTITRADLGGGEASVSALRIKIARLEAEITGRVPAFPPATDASIAEQVRIERTLYASRMVDLRSASRAADARVAQAERAVVEAQAAHQALVTACDARAAEAAALRPLVERGIEPRMSLMLADSAASIATSEAAAAAASVARAQSAVAEARAAAARVPQEWRALAANELAATQAELAVRRTSLPVLVERVGRTAIRAPLPGRVNRVLVSTVGGSVPPGASLVEIVPDEESLLIEARVRPQDIAFVRLGQEAKVEITAYDPTVFGWLKGEVFAISPDSVLDDTTRETFYHVRVRIRETALRNARGEALPIGPGMVANVSLVGDSRTVLQYLLAPITKLRETALREQ